LSGHDAAMMCLGMRRLPLKRWYCVDNKPLIVSGNCGKTCWKRRVWEGQILDMGVETDGDIEAEHGEMVVDSAEALGVGESGSGRSRM